MRERERENVYIDHIYIESWLCHKQQKNVERKNSAKTRKRENNYILKTFTCLTESSHLEMYVGHVRYLPPRSLAPLPSCPDCVARVSILCVCVCGREGERQRI